MSETTLPPVVVSAYAPIDMPNGQRVQVDPLPDTVRLQTYDPAHPEDTLRSQELSYEQYEELRQNSPDIKYPALRKPEEDREGGIKPNDFPQPGDSGNTVGIILPKTLPSEAGGDPPVELETKEECLWDAFMKGLSNGAAQWAKYYKDNISPSLHGFGGEAMETGSTVAAAGGIAVAAGGLISATGVGAPVGGVVAAGGAATAVVGGVVTAVGTATDTATTAFDALADAILSGQPPEVLETLIDQALNVGDKIVGHKLKLLGGKRDGGHDGGYVTRRKAGDPRCKLKPYKSNNCPNGETPHHVVPDHVFREKGKAGARYPGTPSHADGLTLCLVGATKSTDTSGGQIKKKDFKGRLRDYFAQLATHGRVHVRLDSREIILGTKGNPRGTTTLGEMEQASARAVAKETGCDQKDLEKQLREFHGSPPYSLPETTKVRANPFGFMFDDPPFEIMGRSEQGGSRLD
jgi:hypothetical protein